MLLLNLFLIAIATEALTEIVVESKLFEPIRLCTRWHKWCGYCASFWFAIGLWSFRDELLAQTLIYGLVIHRLSNVFHEGFIRWFKRTPSVCVNSVYLKDNTKKQD